MIRARSLIVITSSYLAENLLNAGVDMVIEDFNGEQLWQFLNSQQLTLDN